MGKGIREIKTIRRPGRSEQRIEAGIADAVAATLLRDLEEIPMNSHRSRKGATDLGRDTAGQFAPRRPTSRQTASNRFVSLQTGTDNGAGRSRPGRHLPLHRLPAGEWLGLHVFRDLACWTVRTYGTDRQLFRPVLLPSLRRASSPSTRAKQRSSSAFCPMRRILASTRQWRRAISRGQAVTAVGPLNQQEPIRPSRSLRHHL